ncbi:protein neprosin-like [Humulus lupulus]|uniref:protein neprosin-like n=1 Tax=Humulus lupulus TaxID=3486 RepID=UPI002B416B7B|nr:protein neprosin-like [Humulus lupulus]
MERSKSSVSSTLILIIFSLAVNLDLFSHYAKAATSITNQTLDEVDLKLKLLNKPPLKTIKSSDGDIIDCIDMYKQPAFDHPALKNHTIQMKPSDFETQTTENDTSKAVVFSQTWQRNGGFCPEGTIPIRRIQRKDLARADSLRRFGQKNPYHVLSQATNTTTRNDSPKPVVLKNGTRFTQAPVSNRSVAMLVTLGYNYMGAQGNLNIWNPFVVADEYSTGQIWLKAGISGLFESIEAGWVVNPKLYGDTATRLFVYWTKDQYESTGCFDLTCSGFVQTNPKVVLGGTLEPWSTERGPQYELPVTITQDENTGNWWLKLGQDVGVGYWPGSLFGYLKQSAIMVQWGGEVYSPNVRKKPHTTTAMGSGEAASALHGFASYVKNVRIMDYSMSLKYPEWVDTWADEDYCYSALNQVKYGVEPTFYFGGPGKNPLCP